MTREDIIRMAKECGNWSGQTVEMNDVGLERFAKLVRAAIEQEPKVTLDASAPLVVHPHPAFKKWQGLTDEEIENMMDYWSEPARSAYGGAHTANGEYVCIADIIRDAEKRLKEKNT